MSQPYVPAALRERVAYNTRWNMGYVEKFIGRKLGSLNIIGGGGNSDV
jgi:xylulokinase